MLLFLYLLLQNAYGQDQVDFVMRLARAPHPLFARVTVQKAALAPDFSAEFLVFDQPLRPLLRSLQQEHGEITCDCGTFVQIQALLRRSSDRPAVMMAPSNPAALIACACKHDLAYLRPKDDFAFMILQNSSFLNKGHWLYPARDGEFWGLTTDGPLKEPGEQWLNLADKLLLEEFFEKSNCESNLAPGSDAQLEIEFVKRLYSSRALEEWVLTPVTQADVSLLRQRKLQRTVRKVAEDAFYRLPLRVP